MNRRSNVITCDEDGMIKKNTVNLIHYVCNVHFHWL